LVTQNSPLTELSQVDQAGHRVVVGLSCAYDLYLSRHLQHAELVRAESSKAVVSAFLQAGYEVTAGVKHQLETDAAAHGQLRLLPGAFMAIQQAMACPKSRGTEAHLYLESFVQSLKQSGFISQAMLAHGVTGASLAP
jgi:polar amino acid transport system substrate-binding protein